MTHLRDAVIIWSLRSSFDSIDSCSELARSLQLAFFDFLIFVAVRDFSSLITNCPPSFTCCLNVAYGQSLVRC
jgi:hypothetical protein